MSEPRLLVSAKQPNRKWQRRRQKKKAAAAVALAKESIATYFLVSAGCCRITNRVEVGNGVAGSEEHRHIFPKRNEQHKQAGHEAGKLLPKQKWGWHHLRKRTALPAMHTMVSSLFWEPKRGSKKTNKNKLAKKNVSTSTAVLASSGTYDSFGIRDGDGSDRRAWCFGGVDMLFLN